MTRSEPDLDQGLISKESSPPGEMSAPGSAMAVSVGQMDREAWVRREGLTLSGNKYYKLMEAADGGSV